MVEKNEGDDLAGEKGRIRKLSRGANDNIIMNILNVELTVCLVNAVNRGQIHVETNDMTLAQSFKPEFNANNVSSNDVAGRGGERRGAGRGKGECGINFSTSMNHIHVIVEYVIDST